MPTNNEIVDASQNEFWETLKYVKSQKKDDGSPAFNGWEKLFDPDFCRETFGSETALLSGDKTMPPDWSKIDVATPEDEVFRAVDEWLCTQIAPAIRINVSVGYAWQKDGTLRTDPFWCSLRDILRKLARSVEKQFKEKKLRIEINRLRASHGEHINDGIMQRIENADVLVFDIAGRGPNDDVNASAPVKHKFSGYNANVLYEIGRALEKGKENIFLCCPTSLSIPSDLNAYLWTMYDLTLDADGAFTGRELKDCPGFTARFRSTLYNLVLEKLNAQKQR